VIRLIEKTRLNVLLMTNILILSRALNVALAGCNLKCNPLEGMLVQGLTKVLRLTMIGMNPICVSKDLCEMEKICV
jgi:hypothetical protein